MHVFEVLAHYMEEEMKLMVYNDYNIDVVEGSGSRSGITYNGNSGDAVINANDKVEDIPGFADSHLSITKEEALEQRFYQQDHRFTYT